MVDMVIKNGLVVTPRGTIRGGLAVLNGRILQVGPDASLPAANQEIDAGGLIVFPGLIDPHTHMGQPRNEASFESNIRTESVAAAVAGVTTMVTTFQMPLDSQTCLPRYNTVREMARQNSLVDYKLTSHVLTDGVIAEIPELVKMGVTSFKFPLFYTGPQGKLYGFPEFDLGFVYKAFEVIAKVGPPALAMIHAEESSIWAVLKERLQATGRTDTRAWSEASPNICEAMHVFACGLMAIHLGVPLYVVHTSAKESVDAILYLKSKGATIYGETCPQYIAPLTRDDNFGAFGKISPPLRGVEDCERLWQGIREGAIVTIGTDHGVHYRKTKEEGGLWSGRAGFPGMGTVVPIMVSEGINKNRITFEQMAKLCAENVARLFGMYPKKGVLAPGSDADIVIIDPKKEWTLSLESQMVASDFTVWEGRKVKGKPVKTFVRGKLVAEEGKPVASAPWGALAIDA